MSRTAKVYVTATAGYDDDRLELVEADTTRPANWPSRLTYAEWVREYMGSMGLTDELFGGNGERQLEALLSGRADGETVILCFIGRMEVHRGYYADDYEEEWTPDGEPIVVSADDLEAAKARQAVAEQEAVVDWERRFPGRTDGQLIIDPRPCRSASHG